MGAPYFFLLLAAVLLISGGASAAPGERVVAVQPNRPLSNYAETTALAVHSDAGEFAAAQGGRERRRIRMID